VRVVRGLGESMSLLKRRVAALAAAAMVLSFGVGNAYAKGPNNGNGQSGSATMSADFDDRCTDLEVVSDKDISHVVIYYQDGEVVRDENPSTPYVISGNRPIEKVEVKSGTKTQTFTCPQCQNNRDDADPEDTIADFPNDPGCENEDDNDETNNPPPPQCSDGVDNADTEDTLADTNDPGCHTDGNAGNPNSYDPNDNDETNTTTAPQCSDGVDNADTEDTLADTNDPGCHTDGNAGNPASYDPNDNDETNTPTGGDATFSCRASALRLQDNEVLATLEGLGLGEVLGDLTPFEPVIANDANDPCATGNGTLIDTEDALAADGVGSLRAQVLQAETSSIDGGNAEAGVAKVSIRDADGNVVIEARAVSSTATSRCAGGLAALEGSSSIAYLNVAGEVVDVTAGEQIAIPVPGIGTLYIGYNDVENGVVTQRALFLDTETPLGDVIVAEAIADVHDC